MFVTVGQADGQKIDVRYGLCDFIDTDLFFFQAEDGIRDDLVTGVQTCALPICPHR